MSLKATTWASSKTISAGISRAAIFSKSVRLIGVYLRGSVITSARCSNRKNPRRDSADHHRAAGRRALVGQAAAHVAHDPVTEALATGGPAAGLQQALHAGPPAAQVQPAATRIREFAPQFLTQAREKKQVALIRRLARQLIQPGLGDARIGLGGAR